MRELEVFVNEALQRTGQEISKRNIIKPPQIRGSKKMGPLKTRLSLKESINLMLDRRERMREREAERPREKSDTQVIAGNAELWHHSQLKSHKVKNASNFWLSRCKNYN